MDRLDWNPLKAFLETAGTGSLSAAARKLGLTPPTQSRQVAAVEAHLAVTLFERVGRAMALTGTGTALLGHARTMGAAAEDLGVAATGRSQAVDGAVCVSTSDGMAACLLPEVVARLRRQAPGIAPMMDDTAQATPDVVRVLDARPPVRAPIRLVTHRKLRTARRIRLVFDLLTHALGAQPETSGPAARECWRAPVGDRISADRSDGPAAQRRRRARAGGEASGRVDGRRAADVRALYSRPSGRAGRAPRAAPVGIEDTTRRSRGRRAK